MEQTDKSNNNDIKNSVEAIDRKLPVASVSTSRRTDKSINSVHRTKYLGAALFLIVSMTFGFFGGWLGSRSYNADLSTSKIAQKQVVLSEGNLIANIAKAVGPSVVSVNVTSESVVSSFFSPAQSKQQSAGTGIIISSDGIIITNRHVVPAGTTTVNVVLSDGTQFSNVQVIGRTNTSDSLDIAFLKINDLKGKKLTPAQLGDSGKVQVGDRVVAIGNALGQFQNTVTSGIISGFGRSVQASDSSGITGNENLEDLFQTDAAINEGNSGGPLVNTDGQVIGIDTAVAGNAQGIGFAIPINDVDGLIKSVLSTGKFQQPYLGVRYLSLTSDYAQKLNISVNQGAYIIPSSQDGGQPGIVSGSPAARAGLIEGDIITAVNSTAIDNSHSLTALLEHYSIDSTVTLKVLRNSKQISVQAKLGVTPNN